MICKNYVNVIRAGLFPRENKFTLKEQHAPSGGVSGSLHGHRRQRPADHLSHNMLRVFWRPTGSLGSQIRPRLLQVWLQGIHRYCKLDTAVIVAKQFILFVILEFMLGKCLISVTIVKRLLRKDGSCISSKKSYGWKPFPAHLVSLTNFHGHPKGKVAPWEM